MQPESHIGAGFHSGLLGGREDDLDGRLFGAARLALSDSSCRVPVRRTLRVEPAASNSAATWPNEPRSQLIAGSRSLYLCHCTCSANGGISTGQGRNSRGNLCAISRDGNGQREGDFT
jgi:hypothetical protein